MNVSNIIGHLEKVMVLTALEKAGTIQRASILLGISQPSLSVKLKLLEELLEVKLFERSKRGVVFTEDGKRVLNLVQQIEAAVHSLEYQHQASLGGSTVRIGIYDTLAKTMWPRFLKSFQKKYKKVNFEVITGRSQKIFNETLNGSVDLGILIDPTKTGFIDETVIYRDHFSLYSSPKIFKQSKKSQDEINLIMFTDALVTERYIIQRELKSWGFKSINVYDVSNFELAIEYALNDIGVAVLPKRLIREFKLENRLVTFEHPNYAINWEEHSSHRISIINSKDKRHQALLQEIKMDLVSVVS